MREIRDMIADYRKLDEPLSERMQFYAGLLLLLPWMLLAICLHWLWSRK